MKKYLKYIIIAVITLAVIISATFVVIKVLNDENKITVEEKKWINNNLSTLQNANVVNNTPVFGDNGHGVFFDFIADFTREYQLKINPITYNVGASEINDGFQMTHDLDNNSVIFYNDYYVLVSKEYKHISNLSEIKDYKIGILGSDFNYLSSYVEADLISYNTYDELNTAFDENTAINYMLVPRTLYLKYTVEKDYSFIYHFSDINIYYTYQMKNDDTFSSIIKKYFNNWKKDNLQNVINENLLDTLTTSLNLTEKELTEIRSKVYDYGFVNNNPYEVLLGGTYGGIVSEYLEKFSNFTGVEFKFTRYKNSVAFNKALSNNEINLYFNYYLSNNDYKTVDTGMDVNYVIVAKNTNGVVINSLNSLQNMKVYVLDNSILGSYLNNISNIEIKTYSNINEIKKIADNNNIIMLDRETYNYLSTNDLKNYTIRYESNTNSTYNFKVNANESFYKLFSKYIMTQDPKYIRLVGLYNHEKTIKKGSLFGNIAKYTLIILIALSIVLFLLYKSSKKVKVFKRIKKEDKIKYIDQLTSLKNRNYLNENIDSWNKNRIYPQCTIIIDLNKIQEINDTKGYDEGDRQIKAASNILIRTQLDNSDIMRTDGNEFLIYAIGYDKRNIESYIRKLIKEFKELPYDYSAIISYSLIEDDLKTIEDAINEAVDDMKVKKSEI